MVASPRTAADWVRLTTRVLTRQRRSDEQLDRLTGRKVTITVEERDQYQLDGDTVGECGRMVAEIKPGRAAAAGAPQQQRVRRAAHRRPGAVDRGPVGAGPGLNHPGSSCYPPAA